MSVQPSDISLSGLENPKDTPTSTNYQETDNASSQQQNADADSDVRQGDGPGSEVRQEDDPVGKDINEYYCAQNEMLDKCAEDNESLLDQMPEMRGNLAEVNILMSSIIHPSTEEKLAQLVDFAKALERKLDGTQIHSNDAE